MIASVNVDWTSTTLSNDGNFSVIAQAAPTPWINRPRLDTRLASQMRRNTVCRSGAATLSAANMERFGGSVIGASVDAGLAGLLISPRFRVMPAKVLGCP